MAWTPVEWVLAIYYGPTAHRAVYGRLGGTQYTKDFIQLYRTDEFISSIENAFPLFKDREKPIEIFYKWPGGTSTGALVPLSSDRPHLKWETIKGAPLAWKMSPNPNNSTAETIPGDPSHDDVKLAEEELEKLKERGAGQPYLFAIKLRDHPSALHLRVYLHNPEKKYNWASLELVPPELRDMARSATKQKALAWANLRSGGVLLRPIVIEILDKVTNGQSAEDAILALNDIERRYVLSYFQSPGYGIFFDPDKKQKAWLETKNLLLDWPESVVADINQAVNKYLDLSPSGDAAAEDMDFSEEEVNALEAQLDEKNYKVPDAFATSKTRGSAQQVFSKAVKINYDFKCAVTGTQTRAFLVASHIVPWGLDENIRLDPSNGICLSLLVDRAFELGYLIINDCFTVELNSDKIGDDDVLRDYLEPYNGKKISLPKQDSPKIEYLQRRRKIVLS